MFEENTRNAEQDKLFTEINRILLQGTHVSRISVERNQDVDIYSICAVLIYAQCV